MAENLLLGAETSTLVRALVSRGVPASLAERRVAELARSPILRHAAPHLIQERRADLLIRLQRTVARQAQHPASIERRPTPSASDFYDHYCAWQVPVIFTDLLATTAARHWTPESLAERFGGVELKVASGRNSDPDYDRNTPKHTSSMKLGEYVDRVLASGATNDIYMVANHRNIARPELRPLLDELTFPEGYLDPSQLTDASALWFGPAGTVTPLHHDTSNILFCQIYGRKRFRLVPQFELPLHDRARSLYSSADPESESDAQFFSELVVKDVVLEPGETLFIPACFWHHVRSLDVSISFATTALARPNNFDWFRPGEVS
ncbi:MAG TPA: cupin-like domain-containing protein [Polyangiaceae bacterium]|nr:cupin-like domain-containing protein [Polyangiaceae bacterium]